MEMGNKLWSMGRYTEERLNDNKVIKHIRTIEIHLLISFVMETTIRLSNFTVIQLRYLLPVPNCLVGDSGNLVDMFPGRSI